MNANISAAPVVAAGSVKFGNDLPISIIAGPCQLESRAHALEVASALKEIAARLGVGLVYKTSFDKANRTSASAARGIGLKQALPIFAEIRSSLGLPVLTDVHEAAQCAEVAQAVDVLQIPAFLCRQTDLLLAAAATGKVVNVKKGQFLAPWDMANVVAKITGAGNRNVLVTERGASFGYNTLVSDMRALPILARTTGAPVIFDATHSVQQPGGKGTSSGGEREFVPVLARAAVAVGVAGVFIETHPDPDHAPSDGPNMVPLREFEGLLRTLMAFDALAKNLRPKNERADAADGIAAARSAPAAGPQRHCAGDLRGQPVGARARSGAAACRRRFRRSRIATAAGFAAVFAFTFAIVQPVLGAAADLFGKARLMIVCLVLLGLANILGAMSTSFPLLFATRILAGIGSGGVFPVALGLTSDLVGPDKRQVAIGRTLAGSMTGNLLGASALRPDRRFPRLARRARGARRAGRRGVGRGRRRLSRRGADASAADQPVGAPARLPHHLHQSERAICYSAVFIEGCCVLGLFPYLAAFLFELGETSLSIAGIVIAGFAVGGLFYTMTVSRFLPRLGVKGMMIAGASLVGLQLAVIAFGPGWKIQALSLLFMGWGFYMIHGCLQVFASELSVEARATALSLHSFFFFMGQTVGPIAYGFGIQNVGKMPTLLTSAAVMVALGFACARLLRQSRPADAAARPDVQP